MGKFDELFEAVDEKLKSNALDAKSVKDFILNHDKCPKNKTVIVDVSRQDFKFFEPADKFSRTYFSNGKNKAIHERRDYIYHNYHYFVDIFIPYYNIEEYFGVYEAEFKPNLETN